jgi:hypothetical protein
MAHIEEPDMGTDCMVLVHDPAVLDRHLPPGEIDKFGAACTMLLDEGSLFHQEESKIEKSKVECPSEYGLMT